MTSETYTELSQGGKVPGHWGSPWLSSVHLDQGKSLPRWHPTLPF
jgi:hypothetical protein